MRTHTLTLLVVLALVIAACGGDEGEGTTTTAAPEVEAVLLSYSLEPGISFEYEVDIDQTIDMTTTGDSSLMGEELPGEMTIEQTGTTTFTHTISEGPESGTYSMNITGDFSDLELSLTADGESVDTSEIPEIAEMQPLDVTIVVDEQGNIIPEDTEGLGEGLFGSLGGLEMLEQLGGAANLGQFVGPPLPDEGVTVGDTWSETIETPALPGMDPITAESNSEVVSTDTLDGVDVFVIDTATTTSAVELDLADFLTQLMSGFIPEDATDSQRAEFEAMIEDLRFVVSMDESEADLSTWFDFEAGLARQAEYVNANHVVLDMNIPDETTGQTVAFGLDMNIDQDITYRLVDEGSGEED